MPNYRLFLLFSVLIIVSGASDHSDKASLEGSISFQFEADKTLPAKDVLIWVKIPGHEPSRAPRVEKMNQKNKEFEPRVMIAPVNTEVYFPNLDSIFHSIFSFNKVKKIDLGQYKGKGMPVVFEEPGIYPIGCAIHPWMSAFVVIVDTPFYAKTGITGKFKFRNLIAGKYTFEVWSPKFKKQSQIEITLKSGKNTFDWIASKDLLKKSRKRKKKVKKKNIGGLY